MYSACDYLQDRTNLLYFNDSKNLISYQLREKWLSAQTWDSLSLQFYKITTPPSLVKITLFWGVFDQKNRHMYSWNIKSTWGLGQKIVSDFERNIRCVEKRLPFLNNTTKEGNRDRYQTPQKMTLHWIIGLLINADDQRHSKDWPSRKSFIIRIVIWFVMRYYSTLSKYLLNTNQAYTHGGWWGEN